MPSSTLLHTDLSHLPFRSCEVLLDLLADGLIDVVILSRVSNNPKHTNQRLHSTLPHVFITSYTKSLHEVCLTTDD